MTFSPPTTLDPMNHPMKTMNHNRTQYHSSANGALMKDDFGFNVRAKRYARVTKQELDSLLKPESGEEIYHSTRENGVRIGKPVNRGQAELDVKPGDSFNLGPRITKAAWWGQPDVRVTAPVVAHEPRAAALPEQLRKEVAELQRSGFGGVMAPRVSPEGWRLRLQGQTLPGGIRTDLLILLPLNYPLTSPIGFYISANAPTGKLDLSHLFKNRVYHNAADLSKEKEGWLWFCGIAEGWKPMRHTLLTYLTIVLGLLNEQKAVAA